MKLWQQNFAEYHYESGGAMHSTPLLRQRNILCLNIRSESRAARPLGIVGAGMKVPERTGHAELCKLPRPFQDLAPLTLRCGWSHRRRQHSFPAAFEAEAEHLSAVIVEMFGAAGASGDERTTSGHSSCRWMLERATGTPVTYLLTARRKRGLVVLFVCFLLSV